MSGVKLRPGIDDRHYLGWLEIGKGEAVVWRECHDVTFSSDGVSP